MIDTIKPQKRWHPTSRTEEEDSARTLQEYASKDTSFTLLPYVSSQEIEIEDIKDLAQSGIEGLLPGTCQEATHLVKDRLERSGPFLEAWGKNSEGKYVKETHTWDEGSDECIVTFEELP